jgi:PBP1b-binding outer membrane lipoprotein LpoB
MNNKFLGLCIAILFLSACSQAAATVQPVVANKQASIPMSVLQTSLSETLKSNGFDQNLNCDEALCFSHERTLPQMVANVQENGGFAIHIFKDASGAINLSVLSQIVTKAYGQELTDWITGHLDASLAEDQTGSLGNYDIWMRVYADKGIVTITPKG